MKSGTGDDPFADPFEDDDTSATDADESDGETAPDTTDSESSAASTTESTDSSSTEALPDDEAGASADSATDAADSTDDVSDEATDTADEATDTATGAADTTDSQATQSDGTEKPDDSHIPWVLRRSSVKDDRPNITQFFLRDETDRAERALRSDVEQILDKDVYTLDLREAAYLVAMEHPEEVAETLRDWGYDYLD